MAVDGSRVQLVDRIDAVELIGKTLEREFHRWLKSQASSSHFVEPFVQLGIGDDAAVVTPTGMDGQPAQRIVVANDAIADGTHFDTNEHDLELIGRKAIAVNLSDIAAMGAWPFAATLMLMLPQSYTLNDAQRIFNGAHEIAERFRCPIVGGDTNRWDDKLVVSVTILGHANNAPDKDLWPLNGARAGDEILVSGFFGGSISGRHLTFEPRLELAKYLIQNYDIHAATDVSDSLSLDLNMMAISSGHRLGKMNDGKPDGLGVELDVEQVPVSPDAQQRSVKSGRLPLDHALTDGEDFELILAVSPDEAARIITDSRLINGSVGGSAPGEDRLVSIGRFVDSPGFTLCSAEGRLPFLPEGYSH